MTEYIIDYSDWCDSGGCCQVYPIKNRSDLVFKEFRTKNKAISSFKLQQKLNFHDLAPKIFTKVSRLSFAEDDGFDEQQSDWGYVTERAVVSDKISLEKLQNLVDEIYNKTGLSFWDSHYYNVGFVDRSGDSRLVCIDSGKESFIRDSNAWGLNFPGPFCRNCCEYQCKCGATQ